MYTYVYTYMYTYIDLFACMHVWICVCKCKFIRTRTRYFSPCSYSYPRKVTFGKKWREIEPCMNLYGCIYLLKQSNIKNKSMYIYQTFVRTCI